MVPIHIVDKYLDSGNDLVQVAKIRRTAVMSAFVYAAFAQDIICCLNRCLVKLRQGAVGQIARLCANQGFSAEGVSACPHGLVKLL